MSTKPRTSRAAVGTALILLVSAITILLNAPEAPAARAAQTGDWLSRVNGLRASVGAPPLQVSGEQTSLAQARADINAANDQLAHTPSLTAGVTENWSNLGENVGAGGAVDPIWNAFLNSPRHYQNLTNRTFTHIGIGVASNGGTQYVVHRFLALNGGGAPAPAPVPAPAPAPRPQPTIVAAPPTTPRPVVTSPPPPIVTAPPAPVTLPPVVTTAPPATVPPPPPVEPPPAAAERVTLMLEALYRVDR